MKKITKHLIMVLLSFLMMTPFVKVNALETTMGGIDSFLRSKMKTTKVGDTVIVVYAINYKGNNLKSNIDISLDYDKEYLKLNLISGVAGEPMGACRIFNQNNINCYNVPSERETNFNLVFKIIKDFDTDKQVTATAKVVDKDKDIILDQPATVTKIPVLKEPVKEENPVILKEESTSLKSGDIYNISYRLNEKSQGKKPTFKSSNEKIISVSPEGSLRALSPGEADVIISLDDYETKFHVVVAGEKQGEEKECLIEKIGVVANLEVKQSEVKKLDISLEPSCSLMSELEYEMLDTNVAWIDANGYVIGLHPGKTNLKIRSKNKEVTVGVTVLGTTNNAKRNPHPLVVIIITLIFEAIIYFIYKFLKNKNILASLIFRKKKNNNSEESSNDEVSDQSDDSNKENSDDEYFDGIDLDV